MAQKLGHRPFRKPQNALPWELLWELPWELPWVPPWVPPWELKWDLKWDYKWVSPLEFPWVPPSALPSDSCGVFVFVVDCHRTMTVVVGHHHRDEENGARQLQHLQWLWQIPCAWAHHPDCQFVQ